jgi:hypothetical protein
MTALSCRDDAHPPRLLAGGCSSGSALQVNGDAAVYAPHTSRGFVAPPSKNLLLVSNGLLAKFGLWQARRHGTAGRLERLATEKAAGGTAG